MTSSTSGRALVIFDLCDTLYAANTTMNFLEFYERRTGRLKLARARKRWLSRRSPAYYWGALAVRALGRDVARERLVASLAGELKSGLESAARDYAAMALPPLANAPIHMAMEKHQAAGDRVMIMSSSLDLVVAPIAALLGVEFIASVLGFDGDRCTGRIERDLTGKKADLAEQERCIEGTPLIVYTDNRSDRALIELADRATVVLPERGGGRRWTGEGVDYVQL